MAKSIKDLYDNSEKAKFPLGASKDKTPYSMDSGNKLHQDDKHFRTSKRWEVKSEKIF